MLNDQALASQKCEHPSGAFQPAIESETFPNHGRTGHRPSASIRCSLAENAHAMAVEY